MKTAFLASLLAIATQAQVVTAVTNLTQISPGVFHRAVVVTIADIITNPVEYAAATATPQRTMPPAPPGTTTKILPGPAKFTATVTNSALVTDANGAKGHFVRRTVERLTKTPRGVTREVVRQSFQAIRLLPKPGSLPAELSSFIKGQQAKIDLLVGEDAVTTAIYQHPELWTCIEEADVVNGPWRVRILIEPGTQYVGYGTPFGFGGHFFRAFYGQNN